MRSMLVLATMLLLSGTLAAPPAAAAAEGEPLLTDGAGDVSVSAWGVENVAVPAPVPADASRDLDLVAFDVVETDDALEFAHQLVALDGSNPYATYATFFTWRDTSYVTVGGFQSLFGSFSWARLYEVTDTDWEFVTDLDIHVDPGAATVHVTLPRYYVLDSEDRPPQKGDELTELYAYTVRAMNYNLFGQGLVRGGVHIADRAPDESSVALPIELGGEANGHLLLRSPEPIRVSNGGATTFVFQVLVENAGDAEEEVALAALNAPEGWSVSVQSPIRIPAKQSREVPVLASVPFAHEHGGFDAFEVRAESRTTPGVFAANRLGVLHTPTPQPAGHHPELFLHGVGRGGLSGTDLEYFVGYLNTDADHAADPAEVHVNRYDGGPGWMLDLQPGLRMGLDFDIASTGTLAGSILGRSTEQTEVRAKLFLVDAEGDETLLAESDAQAVTLDLQEATPFELTLTPTKDADYVPHAPQQNLRLVIETNHMTLICCGGFGPTLLVADFALKLPLEEYHDRLQGGTGAGTGGLELVADGPVEKAGRPGDLLTYAFTLKNGGGSEETFVLSTAGNDAQLGSLAPEGDVRLAPGETRRVTLGVRLPSDAAAGQAFEVLVFARAQSDPTITAIGRTSTAVALGEAAMPDESAVFAAAQDEAKETPAAGVGLVLSGIALVALSMRRRG